MRLLCRVMNAFSRCFTVAGRMASCTRDCQLGRTAPGFGRARSHRSRRRFMRMSFVWSLQRQKWRMYSRMSRRLRRRRRHLVQFHRTLPNSRLQCGSSLHLITYIHGCTVTFDSVLDAAATTRWFAIRSISTPMATTDGAAAPFGVSTAVAHRLRTDRIRARGKHRQFRSVSHAASARSP